MARPKRCRRIADLPGHTLFKPAGVPARSLVEIVLTVDEFEALRLGRPRGPLRGINPIRAVTHAKRQAPSPS